MQPRIDIHGIFEDVQAILQKIEGANMNKFYSDGAKKGLYVQLTH